MRTDAYHGMEGSCPLASRLMAEPAMLKVLEGVGTLSDERGHAMFERLRSAADISIGQLYYNLSILSQRGLVSMSRGALGCGSRAGFRCEMTALGRRAIWGLPHMRADAGEWDTPATGGECAVAR
ncbi:MAG: hypothetical protein L0Z54_05780 [Thermoplasmata archaeon]|nr:hypothetical protein [Thermoplasmata archaeon]